MREPWILGISASHNGSACLLHGEQIVVAIQEERLTRVKRARVRGGSAALSIEYCLKMGGISAAELDMIVVAVQGPRAKLEEDIYLNPLLRIGAHRVRCEYIGHHRAHAISAFVTSGLTESAVLVIDGMGSPVMDLDDAERSSVAGVRLEDGWESHSIYQASTDAVRPIEKHLVEKAQWLVRSERGMPRFGTIGGMYSAVAKQIFGDPMDAGKVMGLAPYGVARLDVEEFFQEQSAQFHFSDMVPKRFDRNERWPACREEYVDLAASVQRALEDAVLRCARRVRDLLGKVNLCYAGGVALNGVANEKLHCSALFDKLFVIPAAEDSGTSIGAAYHGFWLLSGRFPSQRMTGDHLGHSYRDRIDAALRDFPGIYTVASDDVNGTVAEALCQGKIVAWYEGGAELGPRALGQRSILCDPRHAEMKARINARVKGREDFRPLAPVVLYEAAQDWFELAGNESESPFMLRVCPVREEKRAIIPAVTHVDGTARPQTLRYEQNPRLYGILRAFYERTGVPVLVNTSLNVMGDPLAETPEDALLCLISTGLDLCVLEGQIAARSASVKSVLDLIPRVMASEWHISARVRDALVWTADDAAEVSVRTDTPWGKWDQKISIEWMSFLREVDGMRNGWEIADALNVPEPERVHLERLLSRLARLRVVLLGEKR
jgi:carbamoyltransferase